MLGVDAYARGWVGVRLTSSGGFDGAWVAPSLAALISNAGVERAFAVVGVAMPIGLAEQGERAADVLARNCVGRLTSSVFSAPSRPAMTACTYVEAAAAHRQATGKGLTAQAFGLMPKLREVDGWVRCERFCRVVEVHPEVSFAALNAGSLDISKRSWTGMVVRRKLLLNAGTEMPDELGDGGAAGIEDVLDAAIGAWTAHRVRTGAAASLPAEPEVLSLGTAAAIYV